MKKIILMVGAVFTMTFAASAAEYRPDDEGFIRNWLVLEAIALDENAGNHSEDSQKGFFDKEWFAGQSKATPKGGDKVKVDGSDKAWEERESDDYALMFEGDNQLFLGVAYVIADKDYDSVTLAIGSDDSSVWWLNGKEVIRVFAGRGVDRDQDKSESLKLTKGVNILKFAVINGGGPAGIAARFHDKNDNPITALKISLTPPK